MKKTKQINNKPKRNLKQKPVATEPITLPEIPEIETSIVETTPGSVTISLIPTDSAVDDFEREASRITGDFEKELADLEAIEANEAKKVVKKAKKGKKGETTEVVVAQPKVKKAIDPIKVIKNKIADYRKLIKDKVTILFNEYNELVKANNLVIGNIRRQLTLTLKNLTEDYKLSIQDAKKIEDVIQRKAVIAKLDQKYNRTREHIIFVFAKQIEKKERKYKKIARRSKQILARRLFKLKESLLLFVNRQKDLLNVLQFEKQREIDAVNFVSLVKKVDQQREEKSVVFYQKEIENSRLITNAYKVLDKKDKLLEKTRLAKQREEEKAFAKYKKNAKEEYKNNPTKYAVEMKNISKSFHNGKLIALDNVDLKIEKNEIHAIVGENGAGKTTLMSILFGELKPDTGSIMINGHASRIKTPDDATKNGIGMVHQHFKLVNVYTLLDNIILGAEKTTLGFINRQAAIDKIKAITKEYNLKLNLDTQVKYASVGEQQTTEIVKLLYRDADILIFDEPTAVLSDAEIAGFLKMVKAFKNQGKTVILITHKLNEVEAVADRVTVIRKGAVVNTLLMKNTNQSKLADMMVGQKLVISKNTTIDKKYKDRPVVCNIESLYAPKISQPKLWALKGLDLKIHAGEIVGLAGIEGNGQTELALIIGGLLKNRVRGKVEIYNGITDTTVSSIKANPHRLYRHGLTHVPEDRLKYGLVLDDTVSMNCALPRIDEYPFTVLGMLNHKAINNYAENILYHWDVRGANNGRALARSLSGGNQQKLVIGREMERPHCFSIYVQPTRGLDLGAIQNVHKKIMEDAKKGVGVLLISYELDEILAISSRIAVINDGKITYQALRNKTNRHKIGRYLGANAFSNKKVTKKGSKK